MVFIGSGKMEAKTYEQMTAQEVEAVAEQKNLFSHNMRVKNQVCYLNDNWKVFNCFMVKYGFNGSKRGDLRESIRQAVGYYDKYPEEKPQPKTATAIKPVVEAVASDEESKLLSTIREKLKDGLSIAQISFLLIQAKYTEPQADSLVKKALLPPMETQPTLPKIENPFI